MAALLFLQEKAHERASKLWVDAEDRIRWSADPEAYITLIGGTPRILDQEPERGEAILRARDRLYRVRWDPNSISETIEVSVLAIL